ncbi:hypothetical protein SUGI_0181700 [Cryptomeria japonica]|nr:hypothetical protein SUGI_0181700 [Cryptomeria japonica]
MLVLGVSMAVALHCAAAATHTVGGTSGWIIPTTNSLLYTSWAANNTFKVGDTLVFNFAANAHNVLQVTKTNYDSCTATSPLKTYSTSPATVNLTESGPQYYICGYPGHCTGGQNLTITVSAASTSPTSSTNTSTSTSNASYHSISSLTAWMAMLFAVAAVFFGIQA